MEKKEEKPKKETPNGETPKGETQKEQKETEDTPAPEMSTVEFPSKEYTLMGVDKKEFNLKKDNACFVGNLQKEMNILCIVAIHIMNNV